jgi:hypothetical protein
MSNTSRTSRSRSRSRSRTPRRSSKNEDTNRSTNSSDYYCTRYDEAPNWTCQPGRKYGHDYHPNKESCINECGNFGVALARRLQPCCTKIGHYIAFAIAILVFAFFVVGSVMSEQEFAEENPQMANFLFLIQLLGGLGDLNFRAYRFGNKENKENLEEQLKYILTNLDPKDQNSFALFLNNVNQKYKGIFERIKNIKINRDISISDISEAIMDNMTLDVIGYAIRIILKNNKSSMKSAMKSKKSPMKSKKSAKGKVSRAVKM